MICFAIFLFSPRIFQNDCSRSAYVYGGWQQVATRNLHKRSGNNHSEKSEGRRERWQSKSLLERIRVSRSYAASIYSRTPSKSRSARRGVIASSKRSSERQSSPRTA